MKIEALSVDQVIANKDVLLALFDKYYELKKDFISSKDLYRTLFERLIRGSLLLVWGEKALFEGFLLADNIVNAVTGRREGFIWTVYNPDPEFKPEVLGKVYEWAKNSGLPAIVFMAENPIAFNKIVKDYGYKLTVGYFEKGVE